MHCSYILCIIGKDDCMINSKCFFFISCVVKYFWNHILSLLSTILFFRQIFIFSCHCFFLYYNLSTVKIQLATIVIKYYIARKCWRRKKNQYEMLYHTCLTFNDSSRVRQRKGYIQLNFSHSCLTDEQRCYVSCYHLINLKMHL